MQLRRRFVPFLLNRIRWPKSDLRQILIHSWRRGQGDRLNLTPIERKIIESNYWGNKRRAELATFLANVDTENKLLLNVGAGRSSLKADQLPAGLAAVVNIDVERFGGLDAVADATRLPFNDHVFDIVLVLRVLHHIDRPAAAFSEIVRCTKRGGHILICEPYKVVVELIKRSNMDSHPDHVVSRQEIEQYIKVSELDVLCKWRRIYWFYYAFHVQKRPAGEP